MDDDQLRAGGLRETGGVVEHAERHVELLAAVGVAHERGQRRMDGQRDVGAVERFGELWRCVVVEPEAAREADLDGAVPRRGEQRRRLLEGGRLGQPGRPESDRSHVRSVALGDPR
jgi:hypothetical protein